MYAAASIHRWHPCAAGVSPPPLIHPVHTVDDILDLVPQRVAHFIGRSAQNRSEHSWEPTDHSLGLRDRDEDRRQGGLIDKERNLRSQRQERRCAVTQHHGAHHVNVRQIDDTENSATLS